MATVRVANAQLWVLDQDEALEFWTQKVGCEVRADITMPELGDFRWLVRRAPRPRGHLDRPDGDPRGAGDGR